MSEVTVRWLQRAAGRDVGHEETVERTEFIEGCLANHRLEILAETIENVHVDLPVNDLAQSFPTDLPGAVAPKPVLRSRKPGYAPKGDGTQGE